MPGRGGVSCVRIRKQEVPVRTILTVAAMAVTLVVHAAAAQDVYKASEPGITNPVLTREVKPNYTDDAMRRKVQGIVEMAAVVQKDGTVGEVSITRALDPD